MGTAQGLSYKERFKSDLKYPTVPKKPRPPFDSDDPRSYRSYANDLEKWNSAMESHDKQIKAYRYEEYRLNSEFKEAVLSDNGIDPQHPKADLLYSIAWEHGHAAGYDEVASWVITLAPLIL